MIPKCSNLVLGMTLGYSRNNMVWDIGADSAGVTGNFALVLMKKPGKHHLLPR